MLNEDFQKELEATLIYTRNSFIIEKCEPSRVTEAISVDEMRHMWWLADLIVKRGGKPSMNHSELDFGGDDTREQLEKQVSLEEGATERYAQQIKDISDREVIGILKHILSEEKGHRKEYRACLERL